MNVTTNYIKATDELQKVTGLGGRASSGKIFQLTRRKRASQQARRKATQAWTGRRRGGRAKAMCSTSGLDWVSKKSCRPFDGDARAVGNCANLASAKAVNASPKFDTTLSRKSCFECTSPH